MTYNTVSVNPSTDPAAPDIGVDRVGGTDFQRVKISHGAENTATETQDTNAGRFPIGGSSLGNPDDAAATTDSGTFSLISLVKRLLNRYFSKSTSAAPIQITCDTSADQLIALNTSRRTVMIRNIGSVDSYLGQAAVTTSTGFLLRPGETFIDEWTTQAWFGVTASGTATFSILEA